MNEELNNLIDDILKEKLKLHYENEELEAQGKFIKELCKEIERLTKELVKYDETLAYVNNTKDKEIERLNKQIEEYQKAIDETTSEKMDLENIIKEAREYIEDNMNRTSEGHFHLNFDGNVMEIYEILQGSDK